jgi:hypothetical protein
VRQRRRWGDLSRLSQFRRRDSPCAGRRMVPPAAPRATASVNRWS